MKNGSTVSQAAINSLRGVSNWAEATEWLRARGIEDIECITPDLAGVPRGKMMPTSKFTSNTSLALPSAIYRHTISGEYPDETENFRYDAARQRHQAGSRSFDAFSCALGNAIPRHR